MVPYRILKQLGRDGKDGRTYLVQPHGSARKMAMKVFHRHKSESEFEREIVCHTIAMEMGVAPEMYDFDYDHRYIVMKRLGETLFDRMKQEGRLPVRDQKRIVQLFQRLDEGGVFHNDPNPLNFMYDARGDIYLIDYGFSRTINERDVRRYGKSPNVVAMTFGLLLHLKKFFPTNRFDYFERVLKEYGMTPPP